MSNRTLRYKIFMNFLIMLFLYVFGCFTLLTVTVQLPPFFPNEFPSLETIQRTVAIRPSKAGVGATKKCEVPEFIREAVKLAPATSGGTAVRTFVIKNRAASNIPLPSPNKWCYCDVMSQCDCSASSGPYILERTGDFYSSASNSKPVLGGLNDNSSSPSPYAAFLSPNSPGSSWCWEARRPFTTPFNWAWLVEFSACAAGSRDPSKYYKAATGPNAVCTKTGGMEIHYDSLDTMTPYKISCIERSDAMKSDQESCWKVNRANAQTNDFKLTRVNAGDCNGLAVPTLELTSSSFTIENGGVHNLNHCNGGQYKKASVRVRKSILSTSQSSRANPYKLPWVKTDNGEDIEPMLQLVACIPPNPVAQHRCRSLGC